MNLDRLINRYLDNCADPEELDQLNDLLKQDDEVALRLAQHVMLLQHLEDHHRLEAVKEDLLQGGLESVFLPEPGVAGTTRESLDQSAPSMSIAARAARQVKLGVRRALDWRQHPAQFAVLAACITLILWSGFTAFIAPAVDNTRRPDVATESPQQPGVINGLPQSDAAGVIARLVSQEGASWDGFTPNGQGMYAGQQLILSSGLAEIRYTTGAKIILEGPAKFTIGSDRQSPRESQISPTANSGFLAQGTLVASAKSKSAKGFTIEMSRARVVDVGTEFGVQVQPSGEAEVVVLTGAVDLISHPAGGGDVQRIRLTTDQGASVAAKSGTIARRTELDQELVSKMRMQLQTGSVDTATLAGITLDDTDAKLTGEWSGSMQFKPHVGNGYVYSGRENDKAKGDGKATATFRTQAPESGQYRLLMAYSAHETRAKNVPVTVASGSHEKRFVVNQTKPLPEGQSFQFVGNVQLEGGVETVITISNTDTDGFVIVDALQLVPADLP